MNKFTDECNHSRKPRIRQMTEQTLEISS